MVILLLYKIKRPAELRNIGPLYLSVIDAPLTNIYFKIQRMGINTINTILSQMKSNSPLSELSKIKKITNHYARKTTVRKLKSSGFPKCEIKNITGHSSECVLDTYDFGNEDEMFAMSSAICKASVPLKCSSPNSRKKNLIQSHDFMECHRTLHPLSNSSNNFSFGINWSNTKYVKHWIFLKACFLLASITATKEVYRRNTIYKSSY